MNPTNPYWTPSFKYRVRKSLKPVANTLGFQTTIPWPQTQTAGYYFGEGAMPDRKELVYNSQPEWFSVQNIIRSSGGVPNINPYAEEYKFSREDSTVRF